MYSGTPVFPLVRTPPTVQCPGVKLLDPPSSPLFSSAEGKHLAMLPASPGSAKRVHCLAVDVHSFIVHLHAYSSLNFMIHFPSLAPGLVVGASDRSPTTAADSPAPDFIVPCLVDLDPSNFDNETERSREYWSKIRPLGGVPPGLSGHLSTNYPSWSYLASCHTICYHVHIGPYVELEAGASGQLSVNEF
ncbi:hypothetical protein BV22DRAFT_267360 [Leucogyrophana mollusca]|uniref:Uncharacterized protein n=1 Tax=Leucogyrophana mollusca TaxID=85980 RepID=A0ACB8BNU8_9AGAM|nr:hypothetical protein BV22DRAFT_267360 [Leucogyrophana mollusca]